MAFNKGDKVVVSRGKLRNVTVELVALATEQGDAAPAWVVKPESGTAKIEKESNFRAPAEPSITATQIGDALKDFTYAAESSTLLAALESVVPGITNKVTYLISE